MDALSKVLLPTCLASAIFSAQAYAHGGLQFPQQRDIMCMYNQLQPHDECTDGGKVTATWMAPYNDWAGIGEVPWRPADDQFANGGQSQVSDFLNKKSGNWPATTLNNRTFNAKWIFTAPHNTAIFRLYITKQGWQPGDSIKWSNIEEFCSYTPDNPNYETFVQPFSETWQGGGSSPVKEFVHGCTVPENRSGRHAIVSEWVVDNTPMSWWGVSDIDIKADATPPEWGHIGTINGSLTGSYGDTVEVTFMGDSAERHNYSFSFTIPSNEDGQKDYLSKTIAEEINSRYQSRGVVAGVLDHPLPDNPGMDNIRVQYGTNQVYTEKSTGISSLNIVVKPDTGTKLPEAVIDASATKVEGEGTIILNGDQSSHPEGGTLNYSWEQTSPAVPKANIVSPISSRTEVKFPTVTQETRYNFSLTVNDGKNSHSDQITILQKPADSGGSCTPKDPDAANYPLWNSSTTYKTGDRVNYQELVWEAKWWIEGSTPDSHDAWKLISDVVLPWQSGKAYNQGDQAIFSDHLYEAKQWTKDSPAAAPGLWIDKGPYQCE